MKIPINFILVSDLINPSTALNIYENIKKLNNEFIEVDFFKINDDELEEIII